MCKISNEINLKFISLIFAIGLYILYVKKILFATMNRRLTFRDACAQLGIAEEDVYDDSNGEEEEEEVGEVEDALLELQTDEEEKTAFDNEGDVEVFVEGESDSSDDEEEPVDRESDDEQDDNWVVSPSAISYTSQPMPTRRRQRNIITEAPRAIAQPQSEKESFECLVSEEIFRTILLHTNRKLREIQRNLHQVRYPTSMFSMEELKASIAIMLKAGCNRDNFTNLRDLWKLSDSRPFYRTVMSLNRIKLLLRCICFDNWHTREQRKVNDKFAAVSEIWEIFLRNARRIYIPGECITVDEQLVGYRGRIPGRTYIWSKPRKYGLKIFWACESNTGYRLNAIAYGGKEGNRVHHNLAQDIVLKVVEPWYGTGRDICTNNYFTSYTLANFI